jgi:ribosomal protein S20
MTKKLLNRKNIAVNLRNKQINTYYKSTVKTLIKKIKILVLEKNLKSSTNFTIEIKNTVSLLNSKLDKGVKKGSFKKNTAARKKSMISEFIKKNSLKF